MTTVLIYSLFLLIGMSTSQFLPDWFPQDYDHVVRIVTLLSMFCLSYIMIEVGMEFDLDKKNPKKYFLDAGIASTAALLPWLFCALYFLFFIYPEGAIFSADYWKKSIILAPFAAPTSSGILFSMLIASGLSATWVFRKTRILAIFDDIATLLILIPLKILYTGLQWPLFLTLGITILLLALAWRFQHRLTLPVTYKAVLVYSAGVLALSELTYFLSSLIWPEHPMHLDVLLPAFVFGTLLKHPKKEDHLPEEGRISHVISAIFMIMVGMVMPQVSQFFEGPIPWGKVLGHAFAITIISNLGKCFVALCYRKVACWRQRLAISIAMFPRGEVGAGVILVTLSYGFGGLPVTVATLSLVINLVMTGFFIWAVKQLVTHPSCHENLLPEEEF